MPMKPKLMPGAPGAERVGRGGPAGGRGGAGRNGGFGGGGGFGAAADLAAAAVSGASSFLLVYPQRGQLERPLALCISGTRGIEQTLFREPVPHFRDHAYRRTFAVFLG
jgi:hypothetical protein